MSRKHVALLSVVALVGIVAAVLLGRPDMYGKEAKARQGSAAAPFDGPATTSVLPKGLVTLRVDFRSKGKAKAKEPTTWDGEVTVSGARLRQVRLWQDDPRETVEGNRWTLTTQRSIPWNSEQRKRGHAAMPLQDSAIVLELLDTSPQTELSFDTAQGAFKLALGDFPFGTSKGFLGGLAQVARMANSATILSAPSEDDFPSAALGPQGELYVAYVAFTHGKDFRKRDNIEDPKGALDNLDEPTGGDQVMLLRLDGDRWNGPMAVTPPGQDVFRPALAVDGSGRAWVFWTANRGGGWSLFGRSIQGETWGREIRLSKGFGPHAMPAAVTDSDGKVWVAWQAFRDGNSDILAARQQGAAFSEPIVVAEGPANQWSPAVAAAPDGRVAVAWDSYASGSYDVYCSIGSGEAFGKPFPVAATLRGEMRPSITFDGAGRLWVAYEDSPEKWGKDWGALEKDGVPLYQGRTVSVRVWDGSRLVQPADDPACAFYPWARKQKNRPGFARLAFPRLTTDAAGRVWLAVRSPRLGTRANVGSAWFEHVAWYNGQQWSGEIICPGTDNILDNRPALVPLASGEIVLVGSSDGRFATAGQLPFWFIKQLQKQGQKIRRRPRESKWPDAVNNELVMCRFGPAPKTAAAPTALEPVEDAAPAARAEEANREAADIARARAAKVTVGGKTLRLVRGEFHRHTELSQDGAGDGALMDMWRYALDAAGLDWIGCGDHDNGSGREYSWWITQKTTDLFHVPGAFSPMYSYERSCNYPDGHRNAVFARRGVRTLPRLKNGMGKAMDDLPSDADRPHTPDTQMLYEYLARFDGVCASHTSGTDMGTDWRDNNPKVEPIVEIYQGCRQSYEMPGAPRSNTAEHSIGGWRPFGFVSLALRKGYRLGFQASSDHVSTHISYCNVWAEDLTNEAILAAMKARHVYGSTDNIIAEVRCGQHFLGDEFTTDQKPRLAVHLVGTGPFAKVSIIKNSNYVHTAQPNKAEVRLEWTDFEPVAGKTSYYYVRGEQTDGELVWVSPMWIKYQP